MNGMLTMLLTLFFFIASMKFDVPAGWILQPVTSSMRVADFKLPKGASDPEDATVTLYFFGTQQGGGVDANMDRWIGQMEQPDGKPSKQVAKTTTWNSHGFKVSVVDVSGTYVAETAPGSGQHLNKPGFRQIAAVVETPNGNYYVKCTGPAKTVARWEKSVIDFIKSLHFE
jgi:hypothetical protein